MKNLWVKEKILYDGTQLVSLWAFRNWGLQGDSIVAFRGPCRVLLEHMVDLEDVRSQAAIFSEDMLHFIIEHFDLDLEKTIWRQRMFIVLIKEELERRLAVKLRRDGDDLYQGPNKLSVSIATLSPVSSLIHVGLNIISRNTPVPTVGLAEMGIENVEDLAHACMDSYVRENQQVKMARCKVRGVD
ncbi:DUF366 family protein [Calderihabitans maritimus]|uniref:DUF366 domain-containing protein n=1 Tax=Calderihabitans maritimus TaxID=1246530 RepID=A0A1Z5HXY5_9FIRM|nr:DUF366 family protein [Calderihabitans maritimus]GAW94237.1 hypothetical protein Desca_1347 [Calderihabitans maritimus]